MKRHLTDIAAEQAVIGACLINPDALTKIISIGLQPEHFHQHNHSCLWAVMVEMHSNGMTCDPITIGDQLKKVKKLDEAGGLVYAVEIANNTPGSANAEAYADIVMECSTAREVDRVGNQIIRLEGKGSENLVESNRLIQQIQPMKVETITTLGACGIKFIDNLQKKFNGEVIDRLETKIATLDDLIGGGLTPEMYVLAGRPSMGKSALALQIMIEAAVNQRKRVMFFSLEMTSDVVYERAVAHIARIPLDVLRNPKPVYVGNKQIGGMTEEDWPKSTMALTKMKNCPLIISDGPRQSIKAIIARAQRAHQKAALSLVVVDHSQLIHVPGANTEESQRIGISSSMKDFIDLRKALKCPVILLHHLNRDNEKRGDKKPIMADLARAGAIEQDADIIMAPHRDSYYESGGASSSGLAEIIIMKNRNGRTGSAVVNWEGQYQNFGEYKGQWPIQKQQEKKRSVYSDTANGKRY